MAKYIVDLKEPPSCFVTDCQEPIKHVLVDDDKTVMTFCCGKIIHLNEAAAFMEFPIMQFEVTEEQLKEMALSNGN